MISHRHKCIFIHISKCAGSSVESAFGIDVTDISKDNNRNLFGWNEEHKIFLQHATPQELLDCHLIKKEIWDSYYKFIVVRNPWDRALSDYLWLSREKNVNDTFENFIKGRGGFRKYIEKSGMHFYRGDHLTPQADYFYLDQEKIEYNKVIRFENFSGSIAQVIKDLGMPNYFFDKKLNVGKKKFQHYSKFYNPERKRLIEKVYRRDIELFNYSFEDQRDLFDHLKLLKPSNKLIR